MVAAPADSQSNSFCVAILKCIMCCAVQRQSGETGLNPVLFTSCPTVSRHPENYDPRTTHQDKTLSVTQRRWYGGVGMYGTFPLQSSVFLSDITMKKNKY
ncbi:unnamed protein product [Macrosiphum euphorbiae]|nr:unnamed protein product [Macrosiphum euphorbiae]